LGIFAIKLFIGRAFLAPGSLGSDRLFGAFYPGIAHFAAPLNDFHGAFQMRATFFQAETVSLAVALDTGVFAIVFVAAEYVLFNKIQYIRLTSFRIYRWRFS
jgi:hypothetical protein